MKRQPYVCDQRHVLKLPWQPEGLLLTRLCMQDSLYLVYFPYGTNERNLFNN